MAIYLIDKKYADISFDLALNDKKAKVVLIQDGVYLDVSKIVKKRKVYMIKDDLEKRGIKKVPDKVEILTYKQLLDKIEKEEVFNFV